MYNLKIIKYKSQIILSTNLLVFYELGLGNFFIYKKLLIHENVQFAEIELKWRLFQWSKNVTKKYLITKPMTAKSFRLTLSSLRAVSCYNESPLRLGI